MKLRHVAFGFIALIGAVNSNAQITTDESPILTSYQNLASNSKFVIESNGSEVYRGKTVAFKTIASWWMDSTTTPITAKLEIRLFQDDVQTLRIVGDGENLYSYDMVRKEYSASNYGGYGGRPSDYRARLVKLANLSATGQARYVTQFLGDLVAIDTARYRSWIPGVPVTQLSEGSHQDPVLTWRTYVATPTSNFLMYDAKPKRTIVVQIDTDPSGVQNLASIFYNQVDQISGRRRETDWSIVPYAGEWTFDAALFTPYNGDVVRGWRPVVGPTPSQ